MAIKEVKTPGRKEMVFKAEEAGDIASAIDQAFRLNDNRPDGINEVLVQFGNRMVSVTHTSYEAADVKDELTRPSRISVTEPAAEAGAVVTAAR